MNMTKNILTATLSLAAIISISACSGSSNSSSGDGSPTDINPDTDTNTNPDTNTTSGTTTDTTKPIISLESNSIIYQQRGLPFVDPGATAQDDTDGDISNHIHVSNPVNTDAVGVYTLAYTVSDTAGNAADPVTRTVHVIYSTVKQTGQSASYDTSGTITSAIRDDGYYQSGVATDYLHSTNNTVTDQVTGLMWQDDTTVKKSFNEAVTYCESLSLGGHDDWRMPSIQEVINILAHGDDTTPNTFQTWDTSTNYWSATASDANQSRA